MKEIKKLIKMDACHEAIVWARTQPDWTTLWNNCERGDWMLWLQGKLAGNPETKSKKQLVLCACECARLALPYIAKDDTTSLNTTEITISWASGRGSTLKNVKKVATDAATDAAAADAATDAAAAYATYATYVATDSIEAYVTYATFAADAVAYATYVAYVIDAVAYAAIRQDILRRCADIVRKYYPKAPVFLVEPKPILKPKTQTEIEMDKYNNLQKIADQREFDDLLPL